MWGPDVAQDPSDRQPFAFPDCRPYLIEEIEAVAPRAVLPTGKHATRSVLALDGDALDGFLESVLDPRESQTVDVPVVPLLHPSYQAVWLSRLGFEYDGYVEAIAETLQGVP